MVLRIVSSIFFLLLFITPVFSEEPFFGFYAFTDKKYIDELNGSPINYLMPYGMTLKEEQSLQGFLDYALQHKINVLFSLKNCYKNYKWYPDIAWCPTEDEEKLVDCIVSKFADHGAVQGWYLADEPTDTVGEKNKSTIEAHAQNIKKYSEKPVYIEDYAPPKGVMWDFFAGFTDYMMTNAYPVPERGLDEVYSNINGLTSKYSKPVIGIVQVFGKYQYPYYNRDEISGRPPTTDEIRIMSYLALMAGAKGVFYYSLHDLMKQPDYLAKMEYLSTLIPELKENYGLISSKAKPGKNYKLNIWKKDVFAKLTNYGGEDRLIAVNASSVAQSFDLLDAENKLLQKIDMNPYEIKIIRLK